MYIEMLALLLNLMQIHHPAVLFCVLSVWERILIKAFTFTLVWTCWALKMSSVKGSVILFNITSLFVSWSMYVVPPFSSLVKKGLLCQISRFMVFIYLFIYLFCLGGCCWLFISKYWYYLYFLFCYKGSSLIFIILFFLFFLFWYYNFINTT